MKVIKLKIIRVIILSSLSCLLIVWVSLESLFILNGGIKLNIESAQQLINYILKSEVFNSFRRIRSRRTGIIGEADGVKLYRKYALLTPEKTLETLILEVNLSMSTEVVILANEDLSNKFWIDWGKSILYKDGEATPFDISHNVFDDPAIRGDRDELIAKYKANHPDKEIIAVLPNGNTMFNEWFVSYVDGKLLHKAKEPVFEREYSSLVIMKNGDVSIRDIRFKEGEAEGEIKIWDVKEKEFITDEVLYTTYGQRLVKDSKVFNPVKIYGQFDDLAHLFYFPLVTLGDGRKVIGGSLVEQMHKDRNLVKEALEGRRVSLDITQIDKDELISNLKEAGYKDVGSMNEIRAEGDYVIDDDILSIKLIRNQYRHFVAGVKDGKLITISILGKSGSYAATIEEAAEIAKKEGLEDAILICNGRDVWLNFDNEWFGEDKKRKREAISSVIIIAGEREE